MSRATRRESEHRLLNGWQLITSLLAAYSRGTKNPEAAAQLTNAANGVATLARVHRHLHTLDKLESVEFKQYLEKLCPRAQAQRLHRENGRSCSRGLAKLFQDAIVFCVPRKIKMHGTQLSPQAFLNRPGGPGC